MQQEDGGAKPYRDILTPLSNKSIEEIIRYD